MKKLIVKPHLRDMRSYRDSVDPMTMLRRKVLFERRIVLLTDPVDDISARDLMEELLALDTLEKKLITMYIDSPGGYMEQGFAIMDVMIGLRSKIQTIICGECCSMATFIALTGKKKLMTANAHWMGHEMSRSSEDYYSKEKYRFEYEEKVWLQLRKFYMDKTKLTKDDMYKIDHHELWLDANQCLQKGIIDEILG